MIGRRLPALGLVGLLALPAPMAAQGSASITAMANVTTLELTVGWTRELTFGTVFSGTPTVVDPQVNASAGEFEIHGTPRAEIEITMTLPAVLTSGGNTMPITFGPTGACHWNRLQQGNCLYYDPANPLVVRVRNRFPPNNTYYVWVGGTITPPLNQTPGTYSGSITLTAAYTGN